jgi:hypothetical protein
VRNGDWAFVERTRTAPARQLDIGVTTVRSDTVVKWRTSEPLSATRPARGLPPWVPARGVSGRCGGSHSMPAFLRCSSSRRSARFVTGALAGGRRPVHAGGSGRGRPRRQAARLPRPDDLKDGDLDLIRLSPPGIPGTAALTFARAIRRPDAQAVDIAETRWPRWRLGFYVQRGHLRGPDRWGSGAARCSRADVSDSVRGLGEVICLPEAAGRRVCCRAVAGS